MILGPFGASMISRCPLWIAGLLFGLGALACLPRRQPRIRPARPGAHRKIIPARPLVDDDGTTWRTLPERVR